MSCASFSMLDGPGGTGCRSFKCEGKIFANPRIMVSSCVEESACKVAEQLLAALWDSGNRSKGNCITHGNHKGFQRTKNRLRNSPVFVRNKATRLIRSVFTMVIVRLLS